MVYLLEIFGVSMMGREARVCVVKVAREGKAQVRRADLEEQATMKLEAGYFIHMRTVQPQSPNHFLAKANAMRVRKTINGVG